MLTRKTQIEHHPLGPDLAAHLTVQRSLSEARLPHDPMPLLVALQFYQGDQADALRLARFLADLEPRYRDDFQLALASRFDVAQTKRLKDALVHCSRKFPTVHIRSQRKATGYPDGAFGIWAGTADQCWRNYVSGLWPHHSVFFCEADGVPLRWDWVDEIKRAHAKTLAMGKRVTGARMSQCGDPHIHGSFVMHLSCWADRPSLRSCPSGVAWDVFHGHVLTAEAGLDSPIARQYGTRDMTKAAFVNLGREYAWLPAAKDDSTMNCARAILLKKGNR